MFLHKIFLITTDFYTNFFIWYWTIGFVLITSLWYRILRYSKIKLIPRPSSQVLEKYYLDPKVLTAVEISALKVRVFGKSEESHDTIHDTIHDTE